MSRIFFFILILSITVSAQNKSFVSIDGGKGVNCSLSSGYDDLAAAIQKHSTKAEKGTFWLVLAKTKEGKIAAQTINIKGKTPKIELAAIDAAEKYNFTADFDLLMLRINCEGIKGRRK